MPNTNDLVFYKPTVTQSNDGKTSGWLITNVIEATKRYIFVKGVKIDTCSFRKPVYDEFLIDKNTGLTIGKLNEGQFVKNIQSLDELNRQEDIDALRQVEKDLFHSPKNPGYKSATI